MQARARIDKASAEIDIVTAAALVFMHTCNLARFSPLIIGSDASGESEREDMPHGGCGVGFLRPTPESIAQVGLEVRCIGKEGITSAEPLLLGKSVLQDVA